VLPAAGCARCNEPATTVVVEFSAMTAYVDLCEQHLGEFLRGARSVDVTSSAAASIRHSRARRDEASS
jgi:hypothetical protein